MKSKLLIGTVAMLSLAACSNEEEFIGQELSVRILKAQVENGVSSRVGFESGTGKFYWSANDVIGVTVANGTIFSPMTLTSGSGEATGTFTGSLSGIPSGYAVYPYIDFMNHTLTADGTLTYKLPASYEYATIDTDYGTKTGNSFNAPMWAEIETGKNLEFKHLGGVFSIAIGDLKGSTSYTVDFTASNQITGEFTTSLTGDAPKLTTQASTTDNKVTITFTTAEDQTQGVVYIPMPTGTYSYIIAQVKDANGNNAGTGTWENKEITLRKSMRAKIGNVTISGGEAAASALQVAINAGGTVTLENDITLTNALTVSTDVEVTLDLNGKTLTGDIIAPNANLKITNGTIDDQTAAGSGIEINAGTLELDNVNITSDRHPIRIDGNVTATINDGTYKVTGEEKMTTHAINVSGNANVTINGGTFIGIKGTPNGSAMGGAAVNVQSGATVTIKGGNFSGGVNETLASEGTLIVYGGTFDQDPSKYVAEGYQAVQNEDATWTVLPAVEGTTLTYVADGLYTDATNYYIVSAAGLKAANNILTSQDGRYSKGFNRTYNILNDIDASDITWTTAWMEGNSNTDVALTLNGQGHTISNLTITKALFAGNSKGAVIKDITFDNVTIQSDAYHVAVVWGDAYGDMTLNNVKVTNSNITGLCNVSALVGSTAQDVTVTYENCSVENTSITATGTNGNCDPTGANTFMGRALGGTKLVFNGSNTSIGNNVNNQGGLVGGGIYGYTAWVNDGFTSTGTCDSFTNWDGIVSTNEGL